MHEFKATSDNAVLNCNGLQRLIKRLEEAGYRVLGPTVRDEAIVQVELRKSPRPRSFLSRSTSDGEVG